MSHFTVGVIVNKDIEKDFIESAVNKALEPFDENEEVAPYVSLTKEDLQKKHAEIVEAINAGKSDKYNVEYLIENKDKYLTYEAYIESNYGDRDFDKDGGLISTYNPKSKWDWYEIGGRWDQCLPLKDGKMVNFARIKDIKLTTDIDDKTKSEMLVKYNDLTTNGDFIEPKYYLAKYPTFEVYLKDKTSFCTYAVLDEAGEWHEPGQMGWFGCSSASPEEEVKFKDKFKEVLDKAGEDSYFVIVDCHI